MMNITEARFTKRQQVSYQRTPCLKNSSSHFAEFVLIYSDYFSENKLKYIPINKIETRLVLMGEQRKSIGRTLLSVSLEAIVRKSKCKRIISVRKRMAAQPISHLLHSGAARYSKHKTDKLRYILKWLPVISPLSHFAPVTQPPILERGVLYLKRACFSLWLKERGMLHLKRACFALRLREILH